MLTANLTLTKFVAANHKYGQIVHGSDGYGYALGDASIST